MKLHPFQTNNNRDNVLLFIILSIVLHTLFLFLIPYKATEEEKVAELELIELTPIPLEDTSLAEETKAKQGIPHDIVFEDYWYLNNKEILKKPQATQKEESKPAYKYEKRSLGEELGHIGIIQYVYQKIDQELIYPSHFLFSNVSGITIVDVVFDSKGNFIMEKSIFKGNNNVINSHVKYVLQKAFSLKVPKNLIGYKDYFVVRCSFKYEIIYHTSEELISREKFMAGTYLGFYAYVTKAKNIQPSPLYEYSRKASEIGGREEESIYFDFLSGTFKDFNK